MQQLIKLTPSVAKKKRFRINLLDRGRLAPAKSVWGVPKPQQSLVLRTWSKINTRSRSLPFKSALRLMKNTLLLLVRASCAEKHTGRRCIGRHVCQLPGVHCVSDTLEKFGKHDAWAFSEKCKRIRRRARSCHGDSGVVMCLNRHSSSSPQIALKCHLELCRFTSTKNTFSKPKFSRLDTQVGLKYCFRIFQFG